MHLARYVLPSPDPEQKVTVLELAGEVDFYERQRFVDAVDQAAHGPNLLVIDLDRVRYMDSIGLGVLIGAHKMMIERGGRFTIVAATPLIRRLVVMTGLDRLFGMHDDVACAVRALTEG